MATRTNEAPLFHGGDRGRARALYPDAPDGVIDLSTGINPHAYPVPPLDPSAWTCLPQADDDCALRAAAATAYRAPSPDHVVAAPGTQALLATLCRASPAGHAAVLTPTYAEYRHVAVRAGWAVRDAPTLADLAGASLAFAAHPNNPDGRVWPRHDLLALADQTTKQGGVLVVDEAFMDVGPPGASLAGDVEGRALVVLRSVGKFFGLAGLRLSFAIASPDRIAALAADLGPWPVSGPALRIGRQALADTAWIAATRARLTADRMRLDSLMAQAGVPLFGGTDLFGFGQSHRAGTLADHLGRAGISIRRWAERPADLRLGLPGPEPDWARLAAALATFHGRV